MEMLRVAGAQINLTVGDLDGNAGQILSAMRWAETQQADVVLFPELAATGYPPEDLLHRRAVIEANLEVIERLAAAAGETAAVVGFVDRLDRVSSGPDDAVDRRIANAAAVLQGGMVRGVYHKVMLPNYGVFDEDRYFAAGSEPARTFAIGDRRIGVSVCEDIWVADGPPTAQAAAGAQILLNINGSPYHRGKRATRVAMLCERAHRLAVPIVYLNLVGGQDELVFDGGSFVVDASGEVVFRAPQFAEARFVVDVELPARRGGAPPAAGWNSTTRRPRSQAPGSTTPSAAWMATEEEEVYRALELGLRDYVSKNGFSQVVIGLSGGIDSALTAAIAADALGPEAVWGVAMPSRFSSEGSVLDAKDLSDRLGIRCDVLPIEPIYDGYMQVLEPVFSGTAFGVAEENIQARIRGALLMAISNKFGAMLVATGNKSEMAVGYATLYGDMAGGFAVLKDVFKDLVYRLAEWRNRDEEVIPRSILDKPPSAELRPDQKDSDSLPEYELLDALLTRYIEEDWSVEAIVADGFDRPIVERVAAMVDRNEYKRRQAAPGVKITRKAFGRDRRLPITNRWRRG